MRRFFLTTMHSWGILLILLATTLLPQTLGFSVTPPKSSSTASIRGTGNLQEVPTNPDSAALLKLLQQKVSTGGTSIDEERIDSLVYSLCNSPCTFDPSTSIDGPLFATCHFIGKTPLWEKIGLFQKQANLKGQKYTLAKNEDEENRVINYSEILGKAINLQARGTFVQGHNSNRESKFSSSPGDAMKSIFSLVGRDYNNLKTCPFDYNVTVTGASINLFGTSIKIPIAGLGVARVLYADPCLRIFVSPDDTQVTSGGGDWESAGLITVQVRVDLVDPTWNDEELQ